MNIKTLALSMVLLLVAGAGHSQELVTTTLGQILDQGAKRLSREEARALVSGSTSYVPRGAAHTQFSFRADGTTSGVFANSDGQWAGSGTWKTDAEGRFCISLHWNAGFMKPVNTCNYVFRLGDKVFLSGSDSDRKENAVERKYAR